MRVVQVNTTDTIGGAGLAAYRLHQGLRSVSGIDSFLLVGISATQDADVRAVYAGKTGYRLSRLAHVTTRKLGLAGLVEFPPAPVARRLLDSADLLHLHHIHGGFFSYPSLMRRAQRVPTVWTLHDMWSFTGGCAYSLECGRWREGCGECPQRRDLSMTFDTTAAHWRWKRRAYRSARLTIVTPSRWLAQLAQSSPLHEGFSVHCIPNGIDTETFQPRDGGELRREWGIPRDAPVALAQAGARKGESLLPSIVAALPENLRKKVVLVLVGRDPVSEASRYPGIGQLVVTGYVSDQKRMADCYALADVFLHPSSADNLPNTLIESMACGTPAVAFDVGGCGEVIQHMETGYAARAGDCADFATGVALMLDDAALRKSFQEHGRRLVSKEFSTTVAVRRYRALYESILGNVNKGPIWNTVD